MNNDAYLQHLSERLEQQVSANELLEFAETLACRAVGSRVPGGVAHVAIRLSRVGSAFETKGFHKFLKDGQILEDALVGICESLHKEYGKPIRLSNLDVQNISATFDTNVVLRTRATQGYYYLIQGKFEDVDSQQESSENSACIWDHLQKYIDVEISFSDTAKKMLPSESNSRHTIQVPEGTPMCEAIHYLDASVRQVATTFGLNRRYRKDTEHASHNTLLKPGSSYSIVIS